MHERGSGDTMALEASDPAATGAAAPALLIIYHPIAGRRRGGLLPRVTAALTAAGVRFDTAATAARGDAALIARRARGVGTIAVAGGDGTINEAINGLAGARARLALIPLGTANVFAAELGLPAGAESL